MRQQNKNDNDQFFPSNYYGQLLISKIMEIQAILPASPSIS